jgi:anti-sigma regulatory factor (Ser/Thr protein kinase)
MKRITLEATVENIIVVTDFINKELDYLKCNEKSKLEIDIAIDELFGNIANYAYKDKVGKAEVLFETVDDNTAVEITFIDNGIPYNPLERENPDISLSAEERTIGGLGIYIVRQSMDDISYEFKEDSNILTIKKKI